MNRALLSCARLTELAKRTVERSWDICPYSPVRASHDLRQASMRLADAKARLDRALRGLAAASGVSAVTLEQGGRRRLALLQEASLRSLQLAFSIEDTSEEIFQLHSAVRECLESGKLEPEDPPTAKRLPRILLVPRTISARAFLLFRRSAARDRIATIPTPRRRARLAAIDAPRRISRGRAPPSVSTCRL